MEKIEGKRIVVDLGMQGTGYRMQGTGYRVQGTGYRIQDTSPLDEKSTGP
jgi:hypothetical protein